MCPGMPRIHEGDAIHSESGICVHGGQRAERRTTQTTTKSPNSALPPSRWQRECRRRGAAPISSASARATPAERAQATGLRYG
jgi:hypothetical protein